MPNYRKTVCHVTSAHKSADTRIYYKECETLVAAGYDVSLIVQHEKDDIIGGVRLLGLSKPKNRKDRMINTTRQAYKLALKCNAEIYHFHDPELILVGLCLKRKGKKVIYDIHEDVPRQILSKEWIAFPLRKAISWMVEKIENFAVKRFDFIITATEFIAKRFEFLNNPVVAIKNYPILSYDVPMCKRVPNNERKVCYVSSNLSLQRAILPIIESMKYVDADLILAGSMDQSVSEIVQKLDGWEKCTFVGFVDKEKVRSIMADSNIGLAIFSLEPNYVNALPTKMFEYMRESLPVVVTNIPILRKIIDKYDCGIYVNSLDPIDIATSINCLLDDPKRAVEMGKNGRRAIEDEYNWNIEAEKLLEVYKNVTDAGQ